MSKSKPELKLVEDTGSQLQDEDLGIEPPPLQSEMPFAVVEGEPMTQLPRDLYIPPDALQVFLTAFEGPLDLLLYLIRKQNLDILNIPIAEITRQYMEYIDVMADLQLELAGEYLLMAAMLAEIKSRMLLPRPAAADGAEEDDPRAELVRRLQEYERFKKAAEDMDRLKRLERDTMPASAELEERTVVSRPPDVTLKEMLDAFRDVLVRAEKFAHHHISRERLSQRERMSDILARLQTAAFFEFTQLFKPEEGRMGVTVTFIAILELMKEGLIEIVQAEAYAPIHVRPAQRHLKVVPGGFASDAADAENAAALAQPELAGENDIPDEDDTPPADEAAVAVEAAVADVAAASSIAVDSVESDAAISDPEFVEAAVSEALASTESAVESVAAEEAAMVEGAVIEEPVVEVPLSPEAIEEAIANDDLLANESAALVDEATVLVDGPEALVEEPGGEEIVSIDNAAADVAVNVIQQNVVGDAAVDVEARSASDADVTDEGSFVDNGVDASDKIRTAEGIDTGDVIQATDIADTSDAIQAAEGVDASDVDQATDSVDTSAAIQAAEGVDASDVDQATDSVDTSAAIQATGVVDELEAHVVEEHVIEEHEVEEHVVPEHVVEEHVVPEPVIEENSSLIAELEIADAPLGSVDLLAAEDMAQDATTAEVAEAGADSDATGALAEDVHAPEAAAAEAIAEDVAVADADVNEAPADDVPALESIEVAADNVLATEITDVAIEDAPVATESVADAAPSLEAIEVMADDVQAIETTNVLVDDAQVATVAAEQEEQGEQGSEQTTQPTGELSVDDDTVTGPSSEADNSDAEPSR